jgi:hypothetical protein
VFELELYEVVVICLMPMDDIITALPEIHVPAPAAIEKMRKRK